MRSVVEAVPWRAKERLVRDSMLIGGAIAILAVWLAWSAPPRQASTTDRLVATATCGSYRLELQLSRLTWKSGEPVEGKAVLTFLGQGVGHWGGSGSGPVQFEYTQVDGQLRIQPIWTLDLTSHDVPAASPFVLPLAKTGGFGFDDPNVDFYRAFFAEDGVRLTTGTWDIAAVTDSGCDDARKTSMRATLRVQVAP